MAKQTASDGRWRSPPKSLVSTYRTGLKAFRQHDYATAYPHLTEVADWRPDRLLLGGALAVMLRFRKRFRSEEWFQYNRSVAMDTVTGSRTILESYVRLARFYLAMKHPRFAMASLRKAQSLEPGNIRLYRLNERIESTIGALPGGRAADSDVMPEPSESSDRRAFGVNRIPGGQSRKLEIRRLEIHVSHACNLTCESCSHYSNFQHPGVVSLEDAEAWMKPWSSRLRPRDLSLLGGEPTIHPQLSDFILLSRYYWPDSALRIVTNGFFLHRHPQLPEVLRMAGNAFLVISIHHDSPEYLARIQDNMLMVRDWIRDHDTPVYCYLSHGHWSRLYEQDGNRIEPFDDGNPRASWEICFGRYCRQLYEGKVYKCASAAYLAMQDRKSRLGEAWKPYLAYEPLDVGCSDEELVAFFAREEEPVCGMCPAYERPFEKPLPIRVKSDAPSVDLADIHPFVRFAATDPAAQKLGSLREAARRY